MGDQGVQSSLQTPQILNKRYIYSAHQSAWMANQYLPRPVHTRVSNAYSTGPKLDTKDHRICCGQADVF